MPPTNPRTRTTSCNKDDNGNASTDRFGRSSAGEGAFRPDLVKVTHLQIHIGWDLYGKDEEARF